MRLRQIFTGLILALVTFSAFALERPFPSNAKRGVANFANYPKLIINDQERRAGPGLRIWNTANRIPFRRSLHGEKVVINYTEDNMKMIDRIWILTSAEAAKPPPSKTSQVSTTTMTITAPVKNTTTTTTIQVP